MSKQEKMFRLIEEQQQSGLSASQFCRQQGIKYTTFNYWVGKAKQSQESGFLEISPDFESSSTAKPVELQFPNGIKVILSQFDLGRIHQLLQLA